MLAEMSHKVMQISEAVIAHDAKSAHVLKDAELGEVPFTSSTVWKTVGTLGPWVRASQLPGIFCSWDLAYRCTKSGWLLPILKGKRRTIYRLVDVLACMQRMEAGELPLPRSSRSARQNGD